MSFLFRLVSLGLISFCVGCSAPNKAEVIKKGDKVFTRQHPHGIDVNSDPTARVVRNGEDVKIVQQKDGYLISTKRSVKNVSQSTDPYLAEIQGASNVEQEELPPLKHDKQLKEVSYYDAASDVIAKQQDEQSLAQVSEFQEAKELAELEPVRLHSPAFMSRTPLGLNSMTWPISDSKMEVVSRFGKHGNKFNDGITIKAPLDTTVSAASDGKVIHAGEDFEGYGNIVIIKHASNIMTAYAHLNDISVKKNDQVKKGQKIGTVGKSGDVEFPQLHFCVRSGKKTIDPEKKI